MVNDCPEKLKTAMDAFDSAIERVSLSTVRAAYAWRTSPSRFWSANP